MKSPFNLYVRLFADVSGQDADLFVRRFNDTHKKNFYMRVSNWKTTNGWGDDEVAALVYFCYQHNPLKTADLKEYGNLDNIGKCVGMFARWMNAHEEAIEQDGLLSTVFALAPDTTYQELERAMTLDEVYEAYGRH